MTVETPLRMFGRDYINELILSCLQNAWSERADPGVVTGERFFECAPGLTDGLRIDDPRWNRLRTEVEIVATAFVSYARQDVDDTEKLGQDIEDLGYAVWIDRSLTGGQSWWDEILSRIRQCDVFVFALSPASCRSEACRQELDYALLCSRPLIPVLIKDMVVAQAPSVISRTQVVASTDRTPETIISLARALSRPFQTEPFTGDVEPPPTPESYAEPFWRRLAEPNLTVHAQAEMLGNLKIRLTDPYDAEDASKLMTALRQRPDVAYSIAKEIDITLGLISETPDASETFKTDKRQLSESNDFDDAPAAIKQDRRLDIVIKQILDHKVRDIYVRPHIPDKKLENARKAARVPDEEQVVLLLNCTVFGSAKDAVLLGESALYYAYSQNAPKHFAIPYRDLVGKQIKATGTFSPSLFLGDQKLSISGCDGEAVPWIGEILRGVVRAAGE